MAARALPMPTSTVGQCTMPTEVCVKTHPLATGRCQPADTGSSNGKELETTGKKRSHDAMQSDGQTVRMARETVEDTPDRTSSEDEQQKRGDPVCAHVDAGLPPMVPVKVAATTSLLLEGIAAAKEGGKMQKVQSEKTTAAKVLEEEAHQQAAVRPPVAATKLAPEKVNAKLGKVKPSKKVAAKAEHVHRRRMRKTKEESKYAGISQASAKMLFQCSCQLLRTQTLDYDVRACEMEERNAQQAKEIEEWEKRIRSLKRELEEYADERPDARIETAGMALIEAESARPSGEQTNPLSAMASAASVGASAAVESSLPPSVVAAEARLREELRKRAQKTNEFRRSVPGFINSLDEQTPRPF